MKWETHWEYVRLIAETKQEKQLLGQLFDSLAVEPEACYDKGEAALEEDNGALALEFVL